ncbi:MAG: tRNA pseudouridine(55) synthase TruB, partial [Syntrophales bacterium]
MVILDKPAGRTSHDVVAEVKRVIGARKAGHTGTLDPLATGVLPVCLNEATKLAAFLGDDTKTYMATMRLGITTDTLDREGKVIEKCEHCTDKELIRETLRQFEGAIQQTPPRYSAVKYQGKALYEWARQGNPVDVSPKTVHIYYIEVNDISLPDVTFTAHCSKGTYIRALCADAGEKLGCGACLIALRRIRSGLFDESAAIRLDSITPMNRRDTLLSRVIPMADVLAGATTVEVEENLAARIRSGYQPGNEMLVPGDKPFLATGDMIKFIHHGSLVAVARIR